MQKMVTFAYRAPVALFLVMFGFVMHGAAQQATKPQSATAPVVMMSDLHFDPLHDPAKVPLLDKAPVSAWHAILSSPDSTGQAARFESVQGLCSGKAGIDTPYALLESTLEEAAKSKAAFVTVSGDFLVHDLDCRYRVAMGLPADTTDDQRSSAAFAEKTTAFVMQEVERAFVRVPVYFALGNNDSRCNHNRLDAHDRYLSAVVSDVVNGLRGASAAEKHQASVTFRSAGYYSVTLPAPFQSSRLLVINDIYMMPKFAPCGGAANGGAANDRAAEREQTAWLDGKLQNAREHHETVWLMGHLPPIVNPDASLAGVANVCATGKATRFQTDEILATQIKDNADVIALGIFGHTHMDELHLIHGLKGTVPIKVVASVTPVSGNLPSFTVAMVNTATSRLVDYAVIEASNPNGIAEQWKTEYDFTSEYHEPDASAASLSDLVKHLKADTIGNAPESRTYREHVLKGAGGKKMSTGWKGYACGLDAVTSADFQACACGAK